MPLPRRWSALGLSQPLGGFGRDDAREPELPRTHAYAVATPRNVAALFHAAGAHGIRPSELSPLGEPCRLPAALCFLAGSSSTVTRRESPGDLRPFSPARPSAADTDDPLRERCRPLKGRRELPAAVMSGHRVGTRELPRTPLFGDHRNLRAPPEHDRHARFEALLPPRVRSPTDRASRRGSRARACAPTRCDRPGRCSPGITPLQSLPHHDLGFDRLRVAPGANRTLLGRPRPTPEEESGASILRSRFSGTSSGAGWPPDIPADRRCARPRPFRRRPCLSCP
jgi:hypothetical protein